MNFWSVLTLLLLVILTADGGSSAQSNRGRRQDYWSRYKPRVDTTTTTTTTTTRPSYSVRNKKYEDVGQMGNNFLERSSSSSTSSSSSSSVAKRRAANSPADHRIIFPSDVSTTPAGRRVTNLLKAVVTNEIPLSLIKRLSNMNTSDFLNNFVQGSRRPRILESPLTLGVIDKSNPSKSGGGGLVSGAPTLQARTANEIPFAEPAVCTPQPTTVPIELAKEPYVLYFPSCTRVDRCGGCCSHELLECAPTKRENVTLQVFKTRYLGPGINKFDVAEPVFVNIERHIQCECLCRVKLADCRPYQVYRPNECRCECLNEDEANNCVGEKFWDSSTCTCGCREDLECSTGLYFNRDTCMCELSRVSRTGVQPPRFRDFNDKK